MSAKKRYIKHNAHSKSSNTNPYALPIAIAVSVVTSALVSSIILVAISFLFSRMDNVPYDYVSVISIATQIIAAFISGFVASKVYKKRGLILGAVCGLIFFFLLTAVACVMLQKDFAFTDLITAVITVISGAVGGLLGVGKNKEF